jgi:basic amino acid/polyamine antiporter, APA family
VKMGQSNFVASDAATVSWGYLGGSIIAAMVMLSTLGAANSNVLATARVTFAMSEENRLFFWAGKPQKKFNTPGNALILNAFWSSILIFSGSFDMLTDMLIFVSWFFYGMSGLGVFLLRKRMPNMQRAYKVWGYPIVPLLFVLFVLIFLCSTLYTDINNYYTGKSKLINSLLGIIITLAGIPLFYFSKKKLD